MSAICAQDGSRAKNWRLRGKREEKGTQAKGRKIGIYREEIFGTRKNVGMRFHNKAVCFKWLTFFAGFPARRTRHYPIYNCRTASSRPHRSGPCGHGTTRTPWQLGASSLSAERTPRLTWNCASSAFLRMVLFGLCLSVVAGHSLKLMFVTVLPMEIPRLPLQAVEESLWGLDRPWRGGAPWKASYFRSFALTLE
jgi:hypothetical protein